LTLPGASHCVVARSPAAGVREVVLLLVMVVAQKIQLAKIGAASCHWRCLYRSRSVDRVRKQLIEVVDAPLELVTKPPIGTPITFVLTMGGQLEELLLHMVGPLRCELRELVDAE
jgi:hypothetical protein